jgi:hypothetical protein
MDAVAYGQTLKKYLPFDGEYSRTDATAYEKYRKHAIACLRRHHQLSEMRAHRVVDDAIAAYERIHPGMMSNFNREG